MDNVATPERAGDARGCRNAPPATRKGRCRGAVVAVRRWWLAADPATIDTIEDCRLEGRSEPFLDRRVGSEVDGVELEIRHDLVANAIDVRGLLFDAGV